MQPFPIVWHRLVSNGETCDRCAATQHEVEGALTMLEQALVPLGIQPTLEMLAIDDTAFRANPSESNRVWIAGQPLEQWLEGSTGSSPCCSVCGDAEWRTVEFRGTTFEAIPQRVLRFSRRCERAVR